MSLGLRHRPDAAVAARYRAAGWWDDRRLADGIEAACVARPDALAVADADHRLTWRHLAARVDRAVSNLAEAGVRDGSAVVLVAGNTVDAVVAYHALLRVGALIAVVDRRVGTADLRAAVDAVGTDPWLLVPTRERTRLSPVLRARRNLPLDVLESPARWISDPVTPGRGWSEPDRDAPRVVMLTSGTTSRPKAVVHSLNTITAGASNMARITGADARTVLFLVSPVTSIAGITQLHLFADRHAALVLEDDFDADASLERANAAGATLLGGAPVIAERMLAAAERRPDRRFGIRTLALGGAMLPRPVLEHATDAYGVEVARVYGSSEMSCATGSVPADDREHRLADDGVLMPGTEVRVGSTRHPQEGLLRGPARFLGYVDPEDDAAAFEDGWFRTGDLVELAAGRLTVVGRLHEVVHRNGLKISLGEIDAALAALPGADEAAAFALPDPHTGERLVVAVRPAVGARVTLADVTEHLRRAGTTRRKLPEQLVTWADPLPRTPSGKVVRGRLVMEAPGRPSEVADRLRPSPASSEEHP